MQANLREQLLNTALELFYSAGYEQTSINAIVERVDVSKGAFYHYFSSKEAVLSTLCRGYLEHHLAIIEAVVKDQTMTAIQKLTQIMQGISSHSRQENEAQTKMFTLMERYSQVAGVRNALNTANKSAAVLYQQIIEQGLKEGSFTTPFSRELAELYVQLINVMKRTLRETPLSEVESKLLFYEDSLCRLLGMPHALGIAETLAKQMARR